MKSERLAWIVIGVSVALLLAGIVAAGVTPDGALSAIDTVRVKRVLLIIWVFVVVFGSLNLYHLIKLFSVKRFIIVSWFVVCVGGLSAIAVHALPVSKLEGEAAVPGTTATAKILLELEPHSPDVMFVAICITTLLMLTLYWVSDRFPAPLQPPHM